MWVELIPPNPSFSTEASIASDPVTCVAPLSNIDKAADDELHNINNLQNNITNDSNETLSSKDSRTGGNFSNNDFDAPLSNEIKFNTNISLDDDIYAYLSNTSNDAQQCSTLDQLVLDVSDQSNINDPNLNKQPMNNIISSNQNLNSTANNVNSTANDGNTTADDGKLTTSKNNLTKTKKSGGSVKINIDHSKYEVVIESAKKNGWKLTSSSTKTIVFWTDMYGTMDFASRLQRWQFYNHFPGMNVIAHKVELCKTIAKMSKKFPEYYDFIPKTYILPLQKNDLKNVISNDKKTAALTPSNNNIKINLSTENLKKEINNETSNDTSRSVHLYNIKKDQNIISNAIEQNPMKSISEKSDEKSIIKDRINNKNINKKTNDTQCNKNNDIKIDDPKTKKTFIIKPDKGSQGRGIQLIQDISALENYNNESSAVAQEYIEPFLLKNSLKFDLRVYVLVTSVSPLRVYVSRDGMARFCTEKYESPSHTNLDNCFSHLTNFSLNKSKSNFSVSNETIEETPDLNAFINNDKVHHKRSILSVFKELKKDFNINIEKLWSKIDDIVRLTLVAAQPELSAFYHTALNVNDGKSRCFEILGFDILLDKMAKPILLEVNCMPSLRDGSDFDKKLKMTVVSDTMKLLSIPTNFKKLCINHFKTNSMMNKGAADPLFDPKKESELATHTTWKQVIPIDPTNLNVLIAKSTVKNKKLIVGRDNETNENDEENDKDDEYCKDNRENEIDTEVLKKALMHSIEMMSTITAKRKMNNNLNNNFISNPIENNAPLHSKTACNSQTTTSPPSPHKNIKNFSSQLNSKTNLTNLTKPPSNDPSNLPPTSNKESEKTASNVGKKNDNLNNVVAKRFNSKDIVMNRKKQCLSYNLRIAATPASLLKKPKIPTKGNAYPSVATTFSLTHHPLNYSPTSSSKTSVAHFASLSKTITSAAVTTTKSTNANANANITADANASSAVFSGPNSIIKNDKSLSSENNKANSTSLSSLSNRSTFLCNKFNDNNSCSADQRTIPILGAERKTRLMDQIPYYVVYSEFPSNILNSTEEKERLENLMDQKKNENCERILQSIQSFFVENGLAISSMPTKPSTIFHSDSSTKDVNNESSDENDFMDKNEKIPHSLDTSPNFSISNVSNIVV